ncbi:MAG TPA: tripartite tricarboxylate transporter substrate binding protein [Burkholderiales bacterium]|nr:tripartite tricarboxylate transporter substrate binding protein [Burkholderiales bacterium]
MPVPRLVVCLLQTGVMMLAAGGACGQNYPHKPIRIVTSEPGSGTDLMARLIGQRLTDNFGKQVLVDNRGGTLAREVVLKAPPDGYTLLLSGTSLWLSPFMREHAAYDPLKDFSPITLAASSPNVLTVHPSLPVESVKDLVALARSKPGELNYASGSTGAPTHLAAELFKAMAGIDIVRIPYKGTGPAINALLGGQVQVMFVSTTSVAPHVKSGKLKALAVCTAHPSVLAPGLPTVTAAGLPGYEATSLFGMFAPAGTPAALIARLNREIVQALSRTEVKERLSGAGVETIGSSPAELAATMKAEMARWGKLIKSAGIREE